MDAPAIPAASLRQSLASRRPPLVIDVRRKERFLEAPDLIRAPLRRHPAPDEPARNPRHSHGTKT